MSEPKIEKGCIMVARKILTSEIWSKPPHYLKIWIYILAKAQHGDYKNLKRGQLVTSIPEIIEECSWYVGYRKEKLNKSQVFQVLEWLRKPHDTTDENNAKATMITTTKATQKLLITIDNYDFYQTLSNYEGNAETNDEKPTGATREQRQPNNINKNVKNDNKNVKNKDIFLSDSNEYRLADYLRKYILKNNPSAKVPDERQIQKWCKVFDLILRIDERTVEDIKEHIHFSQTDSFWMGNILSPTSLRKQYDKLTLKMEGGNNYGQHSINSEQNPKGKGKWAGFKIKPVDTSDVDMSDPDIM